MIKDYYDKIVELNKWKDKRPFIKWAISKIDDEWNDKQVFLIEAPTGYGKSSISQSLSLYSMNEELKCVIALPIRVLLEDQHKKLQKIIRGLYDSRGEGLLGKRYMYNFGSPYLVKPITLTTVDTLSLALFGIPPEDLYKVANKLNRSGTSFGSIGHFLFSWAMSHLSNLVLDEFHLLTDSTKSLNFLFLLIEFALEYGQKLVLMSATIPTCLKELVKEYFERYDEKISLIDFDANRDKRFVEKRLRKKYEVLKVKRLKGEGKMNFIESFLKEEWKDGKFRKIITVFNTVNDAVRFYKHIKDITPNCLLLHSRFTERDRRLKNDKLESLKKEDEYTIISTQVIEAGVDISSNLFISEIAPASTLIQRLGRFLRYDEEEGKVLFWYEEDYKGNRYKVYDHELVLRTLQYLEDKTEGDTIKMNFHTPEGSGKVVGYKELIDYVYREKDFKIDWNTIEELMGIFLRLDTAPKYALGQFLKLGGSFVREGLIVPVVPLKVIERMGKAEGIDLCKLSEEIVPISYSLLRKLDVIKEIRMVRDEESGKDVPKEEYYDIKLKSKLESESRLIRHLFKDRVVAIIVQNDYNEEFGLSD